MPTGIYGNLIRLDTGNGIVEEVLERVPLYVDVSQGGVSEDTLQGNSSELRGNEQLTAGGERI